MYFLITQIYYGLIRLAAFWNPKARLAISGRAAQKAAFEKSDFSGGRWIWVHCASLGEFEQGRPLIEAIKKELPDYKILLTFFSPSGYEVRKNYAFADRIFYLPFDSPRNARAFLEKVNPALAIFVKYEFWHYYLSGLKNRNIPAYLVSAVFRERQAFFEWYGGFFRKMLGAFTHIFVQDRQSAKLLESAGFKNVTVAGDTRVDRVAAEAKTPKNLQEVARFCAGKKVFVCGSTWPPDEAILLPFINEKLGADWKVIIAPHDIESAHLSDIAAKIKKPLVRFSELEKMQNEAAVLLVDNVGNLSSLYQFGSLAYIGGGFGAGIHNTLEPIAFGLPVIFGPKYQKFEEAKYLAGSGGGFAVKNRAELEQVFFKLAEKENLKIAAAKAAYYIEQNGGATQLILQFLKQKGL